MAGVQVENLTFSYTRRGHNLENVNMLVPRGTIYGLLGPSGCCKTTLLRCIVGRLKPRGGAVTVFGYKPGTRECGIPGPNIGYMPQDLSLISQFTVRETLEYYAGFAQTPDHKGHYHRGRNQKRQDLNSRIDFLLKLLDISEFEHAYTDKLSGGQKRRVSLAVAMINDPPLLILDEPTVGVDPIVRDAIWSYLVEQSKQGLTIIVTTHYIEEAASAHKVGFMRSGRILAEGNPEQLMRIHNVATLEKLFLKLSRFDDTIVRASQEELASPKEYLLQSVAVSSADEKKELALTQGTNLNSNLQVVHYQHTAPNDHLTHPQHPHHHQPQSIVIQNVGETNNNSDKHTNNNNSNSANSCCKAPTVQSSAMSIITTANEHRSSTNGESNGLHSRTGSVAKAKAHRTYSVHAEDHRVTPADKVRVLCRKHRLRLFRRVPELVITMLLPALEVALFCLCMGRDPTAIQMAVCNQETPPVMSLMFLKSIDPDFIQLKYYDTPEQAIDSVRNADTYSAIVLAKNFTSSMHQFAQSIFPMATQQQLAGKATTTLEQFFNKNRVRRDLSSLGSEFHGRTTRQPPVTPDSNEQGFGPTPPPLLTSTESILSLASSISDQMDPSTDSPTTIQTELGPVSVIPVKGKAEVVEAPSDNSIIKIYYDGSNALHVNIIRRELFSALFRFVDDIGKLIGQKDIVNRLPIKFEKPIYGTEKTDMIEFVGPGLMVFIVFFATMSITSMAFLSERREGTLERSLIVGMTPTEFITSQIINITFLLIVQITLTVVMGFWIFDFPMNGSYVLAIAMMFFQGLCGMTYGLMLSAICTNEMTALMLGAGSQLMFCFVTGIFWPVDTMIPALRYMSYALPQTIPMESFRHILIRGFDLSKPAVFNGYLISMGWIVFFLILAIVIFRLR